MGWDGAFWKLMEWNGMVFPIPYRPHGSSVAEPWNFHGISRSIFMVTLTVQLERVLHHTANMSTSPALYTTDTCYSYLPDIYLQATYDSTCFEPENIFWMHYSRRRLPQQMMEERKSKTVPLRPLYVVLAVLGYTAFCSIGTSMN